MNWFRKLRMVYKILLPVSITLVIVLSVLAWQIQSKGSEIVESVATCELVALGGEYSADVRRFVDATLNKSIEIANSIVSLEIAGQALTREQIITLLSASLNTPEILSASVALLPTPQDAKHVNTSGSDANGQFYPYVSDQGVQLLGKNEFNADYFTVPQKTKKPYISEPLLYETGSGEKILLATVAAPINVNNVFKGVVLIDFELDSLSEMTNAIQVYVTGSTSVVMQSGTFLTHPDPEIVLENLFELDRWRNNTEIQAAFKAGKPYLRIAPDGDGESFFYFHPFTFPQTGQTMYFVMIVPMEEVLAEVAQLTNITLIASVFALVVLLLVIFFGVNSSIKPLATVIATAQEVTRGNFGVKVDLSRYGGEILELHQVLETMLGSLIENIEKAEAMSKDAQAQTAKAQEAVQEAEAARIAAEGAKREGMLAAASQLEDVVGIISTASEQLSAQVELSERGSIEQAARVGETATAMEEMNTTVLEVARNAGAASDISMQTRARAEAGAHVVQDAVAGIQRVQTVSLALKGDMNTLAEQAKSISEIMNVISDIADQTNLLALNAAIEAARAGDAGRGFAVVADEVRKLAEKTMQSTTDVGNAIKSIQASVDVSIAQVDQTVTLIDTATEKANQSGEVLSEIVILVDSTADQVQSIATASEEQSATSEEINRAINEVSMISEQSAQTMREAASAVAGLAAQAHALGRLIEEMKQA